MADIDFYERDDERDGNRGTDAPTFSTMPVQNTPAPPPPAWNPLEHTSKLPGFRQAAEAARMYEDQTDTNVIATPRFRTYVESGQYTPSGDRWPDAERPGGNFGGVTENRIVDHGPAQAPAFQNTSPMFSDPASRLIEDYALDRFRHLQNPPAASGTGMFEQYAREIVDAFKQPEDDSAMRMFEDYAKQLVETLKQPIYSPQEEAVLKTKAIDSIEQERSATKSRWMEELSRRGITPSSGVALDGLLKIDGHFDTARTVFEREFALDAIQATRDKRFQGLNVLGQLSTAASGRQDRAQQRQFTALNTLSTLAGSEEGRLTNALTYASLPKQLSDNAFQQGLQLVGAGGNPSSLLNSALAIANSVANNNAVQQQQRAQMTQIGFQTIGEIVESLMGGR